MRNFERNQNKITWDWGGTHGVTIIVIGNGISDPSSNPGWGYLHFWLQ